MFFGLRSQERFIFGVYSLSILYLGYMVDRADFPALIFCFAIAFYGYYHWIDKRRFRSFGLMLSQAVFIRLLLIMALPQLSDDYFRFIWDGLVQVQGDNPYRFLPSAYASASDYMRSELLTQMNSPDYYSVYPPVLQWIWYGISSLVGEHTLYQVMLMRAGIILADIGVILMGKAILEKMGKSWRAISLYALNPLVIVELTGNLHYEGLMICFVLAGIWALMHWAKRVAQVWPALLGGGMIALGVMTKMVLLLSLPAMLRKWGWWKTILIGISSIGCIVGISLSRLNLDTLQALSQSLDLYFRNFEFNSSLYGLLKHFVGKEVPHYTAEFIGPYITAAMCLGILAIAIFRKAKSYEAYFVSLLFILSVHLLFSSTVHPWYVVNLIAISVFTRYRFAIVWSFLVVLSYHMYALDYHQVWWVIGFEYLALLFYFIYELRQSSQDLARSSG